MTFNGDNEAVLLLIENFHEKEVQRNARSSYYKDEKKRLDALNEITTLIDTYKNEIERKLKNLASHYFRENKKIGRRHSR